MAHDEPPHHNLHCLQIQLFSSLVLKELEYNYKEQNQDLDVDNQHSKRVQKLENVRE